MDIMEQLNAFWPIILMVVIFYFLLWRPQKKQQKKQQRKQVLMFLYRVQKKIHRQQVLLKQRIIQAIQKMPVQSPIIQMNLLM